MDAPLTIVGTGHAGYTLAREFRRLQPNAPLRLITADDGASYYKPDLSKAFATGKDAAGLVRASAQEMAAQLHAEILAASRVTALDAAAQRLRVGDRDLAYGRLVLATGAAPLRPPLAGSASDRVQFINHLAAYAAFRRHLGDGQRVLIVGAGLIGCEFANDLAAAGFAVTVVDVAAWPLARLVPVEAGRALQQALAGLGVTWRLGSGVQTLDEAQGRIRVRLVDDEVMEFDHVLAAVGVRPELGLARQAGLAHRQGLVVDPYLRTSAQDVYALGDCIEIDRQVLPYILPIAHGARALARTLAGTPTPVQFPLMPVAVKTPACPVLVAPPAPGTIGSWRVSGAAPDLEAVFQAADGTPLGFALTGAATQRRAAMAARLAAASSARPPAGAVAAG